MGTRRTLSRLVIAFLLVAGVLMPVVGSAPRADAAPPFTVSVAEPGPFAPGTAVAVSLSGGPAGAFAIVQQCSADNNACGPAESLDLDGAGSGATTLRVHRRIGFPGNVIDCATAPCQITARALDGQNEDTTSTPITIDGSVPIVPPVLTLVGSTPLPDRASVTVRGTGFDPSAGIELRECVGTDATNCLESDSGFASTDASGNFESVALVGRVVAGTDCAGSANRCQLWALPDGNLDDIASVGLVFDGSHPPVVPHAAVQPASALRHQQSVTVSGTQFFPSTFGQVEQCVTGGQQDQPCRYLSDLSTGADGAFTKPVTIARRVGLVDCAVASCVVRVRVYPADQVDLPISFDPSVPPPPVPSVSVDPDVGLIDRQIVDVNIRGAEPDSFVSMRLCTADFATCRGFVSDNVNGDPAVVPVALPRLLAPNVDCALVQCVLSVQLYSGDSYEFNVPVGFDPDAPLAGSAGIRAVPARGLWDRQRVEVRGERFDPGAEVSVRECITAEPTSPGQCSEPQSLQANSIGHVTGRLTVHRVLQLSDGDHDCVATTCFLVVDGDPPVALALDFDPRGPLHGTDLPPQLKCVAWPTNGWPTAPLPAGVDAAAVEAAGNQMIKPSPGGGDSVVVIHGGRLVYEKYAPGITADSILPSFSVSKSFTSTIIGRLVDDGKLSLDARAPIPEWSDPNDPRHAITLRNILNMSSGLQWNESYTDVQGDVIQMLGQPDEAAFVIAKPLVFTPGTRFDYSTGNTQVLSRIIADTAGVSGATYESYLHQRLLDPLGINPVDPDFDRAGNWTAGWKTNTTTRNFAKLGLLYLRNGVWENKQFLSSNWVDFVRAPSPASNGYGGHFWLNGDGSFSMIGFLGQEVHIIPDLDLIIAVNNNNTGDFAMVEAFRHAEPSSCGDPPKAVDDAATVSALGSVDVDVLANDHGGEAVLAPATLTVADEPTHGTAEVVGNRIRYVASGASTGTDTFSYVVCTNDRQRCVEAKVTINAQQLAFKWRPPVRNRVNIRSPAHSVIIRFKTAAGKTGVQSVASVAVDCKSGEALGEHEPVDAQLHANPRRGLVWFRWAPTPTWTGCRDLEVATADGVVHTAHFRWRIRR